MKKFLKQVGVFLGLLAVCALIIDFIISYRLHNNNEWLFGLWNELYATTESHDVVICGSSRAWKQYNPKILDSALSIDSYNLGINGGTVNTQIVKYHTFCKVHGNPQYVIQNIDYLALGLYSGINVEQYYPFFWFDRQLFREISKYENFSFFIKYIPCVRYVGYKNLIRYSFGLNKFATEDTILTSWPLKSIKYMIFNTINNSNPRYFYRV